jgi:hypothetical protein
MEETFLLRNFSRERTGEEEDEVKLTDPLRWYGVLIPQSLKDAQSRFVQGNLLFEGMLIEALEESIEVANAIAKLQVSEDIIKELQKKRSASKSSTSPKNEETEKANLPPVSESVPSNVPEEIIEEQNAKEPSPNEHPKNDYSNDDTQTAEI